VNFLPAFLPPPTLALWLLPGGTGGSQSGGITLRARPVATKKILLPYQKNTCHQVYAIAQTRRGSGFSKWKDYFIAALPRTEPCASLLPNPSG
jgi:hypothetical protein